MKKVICITLSTALLLCLAACGRSENPLISARNFVEHGVGVIEDKFDPERKKLEKLCETSSVTQATIKNTLSKISTDGADQYWVDLNKAVASVIIPGQETETYLLDQAQIDSLRSLLSEYALTVYDGNPYWPTGEYCTMIELFDYSIDYDGGYYREYGATHCPEGWDDFIQSLRELIISEKEIPESTDESGEDAPLDEDARIEFLSGQAGRVVLVV